jgi:cytochrome P450
LTVRRYPLLGDLPAFLRDRIAVLDACVASPADVDALRLGRPAFVLKRPDDVAWVLVRNHGNYAKAARARSGYATRLAGDGVFTRDDPEGRARRAALNPVMHGQAMARLEATIGACVSAALDSWGPERVIAGPADIDPLTRRVAVRALFGACDPADAAALERSLSVRRDALSRALVSPLPLPPRLPLAVRPRRRRSIAELDDVVRRSIARRREAPRTGADVLSLLIGPRRSGGIAMAPQRAHAELVSLAVNAFESVSRAVAWTLLALARDGGLQERVHAEAQGASDWRSLRCTRMVVAESLRLFPPSPLFVRVPRATDRLPSGAVLPARSNVLVSPYVVQRDAALFPDPLRFDPERFDEGWQRRLPRFAYFPFAGGPRGCAGQTFATMETVIAVAAVARRFRLRLDAEPRGRMSARPGLDPPRDLRLRACARAATRAERASPALSPS